MEINACGINVSSDGVGRWGRCILREDRLSKDFSAQICETVRKSGTFKDVKL